MSLPVLTDIQTQKLYNAYIKSGSTLSFKDWLKTIDITDILPELKHIDQPIVEVINNICCCQDKTKSSPIKRKGAQGVQGIQGLQGIQGPAGSGSGSEGVQGIQGLQGLDGSQGIQGYQGESGSQGIQGIQGLDGSQGIQGLQGLDGSQGIQGLEGSQGIQGLEGLQGIQGIQGLEGSQGIQGLEGSQGIQGLQGLEGSQGIQGLEGSQGIQGLQGLDGSQGIQGLEGSQGIQGLQGLEGSQGIQGLEGSQGIQGLQGLDGSQGIQGLQGLDGSQGIQGLEGSQGIQGLEGSQGIQGLEGLQGIQGLQGLEGSQGIQGLEGSQGIQGLEGSQGIQGLQGLEGSQGIQGLEGSQGIQGIQGLTGSEGSQGIQGLRGIQGPAGSGGGSEGVQGIQGIQGLEGSQGIQGIQGLDGSQGIQGLEGSQGIQGIQGLEGSQGIQGLQGLEGSQGIQGLEGSQGIQGIQGLEGSQGIQGIQGLEGSQGIQGLEGLQGIQGIQGLEGSQGIQGLDGSQGIQGLEGSQGIQGLEGSQGIQGLEGLQGIQGIQGIQGLEGSQGIQGLEGSQGIQGLQGLDGSQGIQGLEGSQGIQGLQGLDGSQGIQGLEGSQGIQGLEGSQGIQGIQGLQGIQGIQGIQGLDGSQGIQGLEGSQGIQGLEGSQGIQGIQGLQGLEGSQGIQGLQGLDGSQGIQGLEGSQGIQGLQGLEGSQGIQGLEGSQGIQGLQGLDGSQGIQGLEGSQGIQGLEGSQGIQGIQGLQGIQGIQGIQGLDGSQGIQGLEGSQGIQGLEGSQGIQGIQGLQGLEGSQGIQGLQGLDGSQGIQGLEGSQGLQGLEGLQGIQGIQGLTGLQGYQGIQGLKGPDSLKFILQPIGGLKYELPTGITYSLLLNAITNDIICIGVIPDYVRGGDNYYSYDCYYSVEDNNEAVPVLCFNSPEALIGFEVRSDNSVTIVEKQGQSDIYVEGGDCIDVETIGNRNIVNHAVPTGPFSAAMGTLPSELINNVSAVINVNVDEFGHVDTSAGVDTKQLWQLNNPQDGQPLVFDSRYKRFRNSTTLLFSGDYYDLTNRPTIPAPQVQSDWNQTDNTQKDFIKNKPAIPHVPDITPMYGGYPEYLLGVKVPNGITGNIISDLNDPIYTKLGIVTGYLSIAGLPVNPGSCIGYPDELYDIHEFDRNHVEYYGAMPFTLITTNSEINNPTVSGYKIKQELLVRFGAEDRKYYRYIIDNNGTISHEIFYGSPESEYDISINKRVDSNGWIRDSRTLTVRAYRMDGEPDYIDTSTDTIIQAMLDGKDIVMIYYENYFYYYLPFAGPTEEEYIEEFQYGARIRFVGHTYTDGVFVEVSIASRNLMRDEPFSVRYIGYILGENPENENLILSSELNTETDEYVTKWIPKTDIVDGTHSGNNWTTLTVNGETHNLSQGGGSASIIEITYADLADLVNTGSLTPGQKYRIIDFVTKVNENPVRNNRTGADMRYYSQEHPFDLIVTAVSEYDFDHKAIAICNSEDEYYFRMTPQTNNEKYIDLSKWEVWYDFFGGYEYEWSNNWIKTAYHDPYGCIFFRKHDLDDYSSDHPFAWYSDDATAYDIPDIVYTDKTSIASSGETAYYKNTYGVITSTNVSNYGISKGDIYRLIDEKLNDCPYDFKNIMFTTNTNHSYRLDADNEITLINRQERYFTFTYHEETGEFEPPVLSDYSLYKGCNHNVIKPYLYYLDLPTYYNGTFHKRQLNFNIFRQDDYDVNNRKLTNRSIEYNKFDENSYYNMFHYNSHNNEFGSSAICNIFGFNAEFNTAKAGFQYNRFGFACKSNSFGESCHDIIFGNTATDNIFEGNDSHIYLRCIVDESDSTKYIACDQVNNCYVESNNHYIHLIDYAGASAYPGFLQMYHICNNCSGTASSTIVWSDIIVYPNRQYQTKIARKRDGTIIDYCEADLV